MITTEKTLVTVHSTVNDTIEKVWRFWTEPIHIMHWNNASDDWLTSRAENDFRPGGKFLYRMESRDGSQGFDFGGIYSEIIKNKKIEYTIDDGRKVYIFFESGTNQTKITERFETESMNPIELQQQGWQAILNNFKKYVESTDELRVLHFDININTSPDKVYSIMLDEKTYSKWTSVFNPTSHYEGSWEKGSKIKFIGIDAEGNRGGMVSHIRENIPNRFISIEHLGIIKGEEEITGEWSGFLENYSFIADNKTTCVTVEMDTDEEYRSYFSETWPIALNKLKQICEE